MHNKFMAKAPDRVIGPDHLKAHVVETWALPDGLFEIQVWHKGEAAPMMEWHAADWEEALCLHAVAWNTVHQKEEARRKFGR